MDRSVCVGVGDGVFRLIGGDNDLLGLFIACGAAHWGFVRSFSGCGADLCGLVDGVLVCW